MPVRLLHMSDIHFGAEDAEALAAATAFARATAHDLLVVTGDLTQGGHPNEFAAARAWLTGLTGPRLATPGNHDTPWLGLAERATAPFAAYAHAVGPPDDAAFDGGGLAVRTLNSARGWQIRLNWSKGEVTGPQARRAAERFAAAAPGALRVLACHHPLVEAVGGPMTGRVRGGRYAAKRMTTARVDVVMTGHLHWPFVQPLPHGDGLTYAVGAGTLSARLRGAPPGFNIIETLGEELSVTAMAWDGRALSAERNWRVPLRRRAPDGG